MSIVRGNHGIMPRKGRGLPRSQQTSRATRHFFLFFFLFSFFLLIKLGLFLLFLLAFVFFSFITHICFSLFESGFPRWLLPTPLFDVRASRQPPGKRVPLVFVPRSGRYGAGGKTWRHISQSGRVPPDRRLTDNVGSEDRVSLRSTPSSLTGRP